MFCNQCGAQVENGMTFCTNCGAKVNEVPPVPMEDQDQTVVIDSFVQPEQPANPAPQQDWNSQPSNNWNDTPNNNWNSQPSNNWNDTPNNNWNSQPSNNWQNNQPANNWNNVPDNMQSKAPRYDGNASQGSSVPGNSWNNGSWDGNGNYNYYNNNNSAHAPGRSVGFGEAVKLYFENFTNFTGRATKSEYWWAWLFNMLVSMVLTVIPVVGPIISLVLSIGGLSLSVRRLHDTGVSWVFLLWSFVPLFGAIVLIIRFCQDSDGNNQWGPVPTK